MNQRYIPDTQYSNNSTVTRLRTGRLGFDSRRLQWRGCFLFATASRPALELE